MKTILITPFAIVSLFLAACGQKSAQITTSASAPSSAPSAASDTPDYSGVASSSVAGVPPEEQSAPSASPNAATGARPVFKSENATQAANQYLDSYGSVINDLNTPQQVPHGNQDAMLSSFTSYTQKVARDVAELQNRQRQVDSQLTTDERKRLRQYQKNLEQAGQD